MNVLKEYVLDWFMPKHNIKNNTVYKKLVSVDSKLFKQCKKCFATKNEKYIKRNVLNPNEIQMKLNKESLSPSLMV